MDADRPPESSDGLLDAAKRCWSTFRKVLENRLELFLVELQEERIRLFDALLLAAVAVVCASTALVLLTLTVVILCWDSYRLLSLGVLIVVYSVGAGAAFLALRRRLRQWESFKATRGQLRKDSACFETRN